MCSRVSSAREGRGAAKFDQVWMQLLARFIPRSSAPLHALGGPPSCRNSASRLARLYRGPGGRLCKRAFCGLASQPRLSPSPDYGSPLHTERVHLWLGGWPGRWRGCKTRAAKSQFSKLAP